MHNLYNRLGFLDIDALGFQQAILFFIIGVVILLSGGSIIQDKIYKDLPITGIIISGITQTFFGSLYFYTVYMQHYGWFMRFSWIAAAIWFAFSGLLFANLRGVEGLFYFVQGVTNIYCCYSCRGKRSYY